MTYNYNHVIMMGAIANIMPRAESLTMGRMIDAKQCRAARAMLRWGIRELASRAGVAMATVANFEREVSTPVRATNEAIQRALEAAGVEFTNGHKPGVRWKGPLKGS